MFQVLTLVILLWGLQGILPHSNYSPCPPILTLPPLTLISSLLTPGKASREKKKKQTKSLNYPGLLGSLKLKTGGTGSGTWEAWGGGAGP